MIILIQKVNKGLKLIKMFLKNQFYVYSEESMHEKIAFTSV